MEKQKKKKKEKKIATIERGEASSILDFVKRICDAMGLRHARLQIWVFGRGMPLVDANDFACISLFFFFYSFHANHIGGDSTKCDFRERVRLSFAGFFVFRYVLLSSSAWSGKLSMMSLKRDDFIFWRVFEVIL